MPVVATSIWYEWRVLNGWGRCIKISSVAWTHFSIFLKKHQSWLELKVGSYSRNAAQYWWMPVVAIFMWYEWRVLNGWGRCTKTSSHPWTHYSIFLIKHQSWLELKVGRHRRNCSTILLDACCCHFHMVWVEGINRLGATYQICSNPWTHFSIFL